MPNMHIWDAKDPTAEIPPQIAEAIGEVVERAWLSVEHQTFLFRFRRNRVMHAERMHAVGTGALAVTIGILRPGKPGHFDDLMPERPPQLDALTGRTFEGVEGDGGVLLFSGGVGVVIMPDGIRWVRERKEEERL